MTPEQQVFFKVSDCIFMKPCTKLSPFIMSSSGSHSHRFPTVEKSTVRAATNSYLQFSHTPKQAGLALQALDVSCDWILWLTELCHWHPQNQGPWLKRVGFTVAHYLDSPIMEKKKDPCMRSNLHRMRFSSTACLPQTCSLVPSDIDTGRVVPRPER